MLKRKFLLSCLLMATIFYANQAFAQSDDSCSFRIELSSANLAYGDSLVALEINFENNCHAGGLQFRITTSPDGVIVPYDIDFTGGRIEYWELLRTKSIGASAGIGKAGLRL